MTTFIASAQQKSNNKAKACSIKVNFKGEKAKSRIEQELNREKGILKVVADTISKVVTVNYNDKHTNPEKINQAIERMGYVTTLSSFEKKKIRSCSSDPEKAETKK
ncbi:MAG: heavy metal-associated domain-containing protein [Bacteroidetes bacterium]|nr:heavy metal-associated domain-containing protein [Bacteroidota bacterium]